MDQRARYADVAIVGGAGFLGLHVCRYLADRNVRVSAVDLRPDRPAGLTPRAEYIGACDATNAASVAAAVRGCSAVINLVGFISYWRQDGPRLFAINAAGARATARACADAGVERFVHVSSNAALGFSNDPDHPIDEEFRFDWQSPYAKPYMASKRAGEDAVSAVVRPGFSVAVALPAAMYGPGDVTNTARLFAAVRDGRIKLVPPGGNAVADVRDVARGLVLLLEAADGPSRVLFVGHNLTNVEIASAVGQTVGRTVPPKELPRWTRWPLCTSLRMVERFLPRKNMVAPDDLELGFMYRYASAARAEGLLGWRPQYSFQETVADQASDLRERGLL
ncbi:MAG: NAD-dependent epimerase/dehydratase family protein [Gemmatimonadetes bacterium]|nr:NAD-dependent epimerase/dehydratase family protein [Gemmatimonadota bacterium]